MTWGSFPADQSGGFTGGRQVATLVGGLPAPGTERIRKVLTEQGLFVAQTVSGAVYHWGLHFDLTAQQILRDVTAVQVLNLPPVRDIMPGGFLGYGERPFDRVTAMGADPNGGFWKIRGRVAELFDPANPTLQRRPKSQSPRPDCASCHHVLPTWPIKAPTPTNTAACVLPSFKLDAAGRPILVSSQTECTMCHNNSPLPFLNCVIPTLPAPSAPSIPPITTTACQIPTVHVVTPSGTVCATCHNSIIAQPLKCLPNTASDPLAPTTRVAITAVTDDAIPVTGNIAIGGITNDLTPTITGSVGATLVAGQSIQVLRNGTVVGTPVISGSTWSFTDSTRAQGTYTYTARVVQDGHFGPLSPNHTITIDNTPPSATITVLNFLDNAGAVTGAITGTSTDDNTPQIQGSLSAALAAGESVRVSVDGAPSTAATVVGTTFDFASPTLTDASHTFDVRIVDGAGNASSIQTRSLVVNTSSALGITATASILNALDDVGSIQLPLGNNSVSDDSSPTLRGRIGRPLIPSNGEQVRIYRSGSQALATASVTAQDWSFTPTPALADGLYTYTAQIVDSQGRTGSISNTFTIRIDRVAPGTSVAVSGTADYPPVSGGISGTTNDNTPRISIALGAPKGADESFVISRTVGSSAATINPSISSSGSTNTTFIFQDIISGTFADVSSPTPVDAPASGPRYTGPALPQPLFSAQSVQYSVRLTDAAGNQGVPSTFSFTLNYPLCLPRQPANHTSSTDCAACHRIVSGLVMAPPGPTPKYWCRYPG
jgi:Bacterial Ig-like domain